MKAPKQVLMTADAVGGVWTYAMELCRALAERDVHVTLATMGPRPSDAQRQEGGSIRGFTLVEADYKLEWMEDPWQDVEAAGGWLLDLERRVKPDIVHLNGYVHGALPWRTPSVCIAHSCVFSWWHAVHGNAPPASWARYRERVQTGLAGCTEVVAISRWMASEIRRHYDVAVDSVIYNGRSWAPRRATKQPFVFSSGRVWDGAKNIALLEEAAPAIRWPVFVAGSTRHPDGGAVALKASVGLGQISEEHIRQWFANAGIYVLPARYEPFGLSPLEAAISGCALVLGDIPTLREIWGDAALYVPTDDAEALTLAANALAARPAMLKEFASRARSRAMHFTTEQMAEGYLRVYERARKRAEGAEAKCAS